VCDNVLIFYREPADVGVRTVDPEWLQRDAITLLDLDEVKHDQCVLIILNDASGFNAKVIDVWIENSSDLVRGRTEIDYGRGIGGVLRVNLFIFILLV
jgi:hypothetical protein